MADRPDTPDSVKRQLRQEALFGCCKCGLPFLEYHHIIPYSVEAHFRPEDMMAFCATHHQAAERGAFTETEQRSMKFAPYNSVEKIAKGTIYLKQDYIAADVGNGVILVGDELNISLGCKIVLSLRRSALDTLLLSTEITSAENRPLVRIDANDWTSLDEMPWDIEADWRKVKIRQATRKIRFEIDATKVPMRLRGSWHWGGHPVKFMDGLCQIGHAQFANLGLVGMNFSATPEGTTLEPSDGSGMIVSEPEPRERLYKCKNALYGLRKKRA